MMKLLDIVRKLPAMREALLEGKLLTWADQLLGPELRAASNVVLDGVTTDNLDDRLDEMFTCYANYHMELPAAFRGVDPDVVVDFAYDSSVPVGLRAGFVKVAHGLLALIVMARAIEKEKPLDGTVAYMLASSVAIGLRTLSDGALLVIPPVLAGGWEALEKRLTPYWQGAERYREYLESFLTRQ